MFSDYDDDYPNVDESFKLMDEAVELVGHNLMRYDVPAFEKLTGYKVDRNKVTDTMILSKLLYFPRKHSLKALAERTGVEQKLEFDNDFSAYSKEMLEYCIGDVKANLAVYDMLMKEKQETMRLLPNFTDALNICLLYTSPSPRDS